MAPDTGIWNKLTRVVLVLFCLAGLLALGLWHLPLIQQNQRMRNRIHALESELEQERETSRQLQAAIHSLNNDPKAVERLVREKLGHARPDEVVFRFDPPPSNTPAYQP